MKTILLFGAGKSATVLIAYLVRATQANGWQLIVADTNADAIAARLHQAPSARAEAIDIVQEPDRRSALVATADVVISLMPPALHLLLAEDCLAHNKHLLTASYIDNSLRQHATAIANKGLLFLCEMGLDPGIDHMSALKTVHQLQAKGARITAFRSHCGGLVAPESDDTPWHYKISWNPRNVVLAGKAGAVYKEQGVVRKVSYEQLFQNAQQVEVPQAGTYAFYPNRDSLSYATLYGLEDTDTFLRTTLRHPAFCNGWQQIVALGLTNETSRYDTNGMTLAAFYQAHFEQHDAARLWQRLVNGQEDFSFNQQMLFLGLTSEDLINKGMASAADVLQFALEKKLALAPHDKDMVIMLHEIRYTHNDADYLHTSTLVVKGTNSMHTAMATTVGLPLGIAATLLLQGKLSLTGLHIPTVPELYEPVLQALKAEGIVFEEEVHLL